MRPDLELEVTLVFVQGIPTLQITGADMLTTALQSKEGGRYLASLTKTYRRRTDRQNRYIWGVVVPCVRRWLMATNGDSKTPDEVYYFLRSVVGDSLVITNIEGHTVPTLSGKRFSNMSTIEFAHAVESIYRYFSERGLAIPPPIGDCLLTSYTK